MQPAIHQRPGPTRAARCVHGEDMPQTSHTRRDLLDNKTMSPLKTGRRSEMKTDTFARLICLDKVANRAVTACRPHRQRTIKTHSRPGITRPQMIVFRGQAIELLPYFRRIDRNISCVRIEYLHVCSSRKSEMCLFYKTCLLAYQGVCEHIDGTRRSALPPSMCSQKQSNYNGYPCFSTISPASSRWRATPLMT